MAAPDPAQRLLGSELNQLDHANVREGWKAVIRLTRYVAGLDQKRNRKKSASGLPRRTVAMNG